MTGEKTIIEPSVEQIKSGEVKNPKSIRVQTSLAGGRHKPGIVISTEWSVVYGSKKVFYLSGQIETRLNKVPLLSIDVPDQHLREVRKVARVIFDLKRFDGIELFEQFIGDQLFMTDLEQKWFIDERDLVFWRILEKPETLYHKIHSFTMERLEKEISPNRLKEVIADAQVNSNELWTRILYLLNQADSGINALEILGSLKGGGLAIQDLEQLWIRIHEKREFPANIRNFLTE